MHVIPLFTNIYSAQLDFKRFPLSGSTWYQVVFVFLARVSHESNSFIRLKLTIFEGETREITTQ